MRKAPMPEIDDDDDKAHDAFWDKVGTADWRENPENVLKTIDTLLKERGLEIRKYKFDGDQVVFDIVEIGK